MKKYHRKKGKKKSTNDYLDELKRENKRLVKMLENQINGIYGLHIGIHKKMDRIENKIIKQNGIEPYTTLKNKYIPLVIDELLSDGNERNLIDTLTYAIEHSFTDLDIRDIAEELDLYDRSDNEYL